MANLDISHNLRGKLQNMLNEKNSNFLVGTKDYNRMLNHKITQASSPSETEYLTELGMLRSR